MTTTAQPAVVVKYGPDTITSRARSLARIVDNGVRDGLPEPYGLSSLNYTEPTISVREFADVEAWADWLGWDVKTRLSHDGEAEFCEASGRRDGFTLRVMTNRPVVR